MRTSIALAAGLAASLGSHARAQIPANVLVVNANAPVGVSDGLTWPTAYRTLKEALDAAYASASTPNVRDEIWIAAGSYVSPLTPGSFCSGTITLLPEPFRIGEQPLPNMQVYGGFNATETDRSQRNFTTNIVTLIPSTTNVLAQVISGGAVSVRNSGVLDGVTIQGTTREVPCTFAVAGPTSAALNESATLRNARLSFSQRGTPIVQARGNSRLIAVTLQTTNSAELLDDASIRDSLITNCSPSTGTFGGEWTGLVCRGRNRVENTRVVSNTYNASTPVSGGGAGISATPQTLIVNSRIEANRVTGPAASSGTYIAGVRGGTLVNTIVQANFRSATSYAVTDATLINCTIAINKGTIAGGSFGRGVANSVIRNTIIWGHASNVASSLFNDQVTNPTELSYSIVEGFTPADAPPAGAPGTSASNPQLNALLIPALGSPAIDAARNLALNSITTAGGTATLFTDVNGFARFSGGPGTDGLPAPDGAAPRLDIGAIESPQSGVFCYPNQNASTIAPVLGAADFSTFLTRYRAGHPIANCDGSTTPPTLGAADFSCFLAKYRAGCN